MKACPVAEDTGLPHIPSSYDGAADSKVRNKGMGEGRGKRSIDFIWIDATDITQSKCTKAPIHQYQFRQSLRLALLTHSALL